MISKSASQPSVATRVNNLEQKTLVLMAAMDRIFRTVFKGSYVESENTQRPHYKYVTTYFDGWSSEQIESSIFELTYGSYTLDGFINVAGSSSTLADMTVGNNSLISDEIITFEGKSIADFSVGEEYGFAHKCIAEGTSLASFVYGGTVDDPYLQPESDPNADPEPDPETNPVTPPEPDKTYWDWMKSPSIPGYFYKVIYDSYQKYEDVFGLADDPERISLLDFICFTNEIISAKNPQPDPDDPDADPPPVPSEVSLKTILFGTGANQKYISSSSDGSFFKAVFGTSVFFNDGIDGAFYGKDSLWNGVSDKISELESEINSLKSRVSSLEGS